MVKFDFYKFCDLQGHFNDLSSKLENIIYLSLFCITGVIIILFNSYVIFKGAVKCKTLRRKRNMFVLSLILSDLCFGLIFIPLFAVELARGFNRTSSHVTVCDVRSWRVLAFTYLFSTRLLSILAISINTYIKTCKAKTKLEFWFDRYGSWLSMIIIWLVTLFVLFVVAGSEIKAGKTLGTITYVYFFVSITITLVCYVLAYLKIKRAKTRSSSRWYDEAIDFVKGILIVFLVTTIPIVLLGSILVGIVYAHESRTENEVLEHHVYLAALLISTIDAIANPIVYIRKFKEFRQFRSTVRIHSSIRSTMPLRKNVDKIDFAHETLVRDNSTYTCSTIDVNNEIEEWNDGSFDGTKNTTTKREKYNLTKYNSINTY